MYKKSCGNYAVIIECPDAHQYTRRHETKVAHSECTGRPGPASGRSFAPCIAIYARLVDECTGRPDGSQYTECTDVPHIYSMCGPVHSFRTLADVGDYCLEN